MASVTVLPANNPSQTSATVAGTPATNPAVASAAAAQTNPAVAPTTTATTSANPYTASPNLLATTPVFASATPVPSPSVNPVALPTQITSQQAFAVATVNESNPNFGLYGTIPYYAGPGVYATPAGNYYVVNTPAQFQAIEPGNPLESNISSTTPIIIPTSIPVNETPTAAPLPASVPTTLTLAQVSQYFGTELGSDAIAYINGALAAGLPINSQALANAIVEDQVQNNPTNISDVPITTIAAGSTPPAAPTATLSPTGELTVTNVGSNPVTVGSYTVPQSQVSVAGVQPSPNPVVVPPLSPLQQLINEVPQQTGANFNNTINTGTSQAQTALINTLPAPITIPTSLPTVAQAQANPVTSTSIIGAPTNIVTPIEVQRSAASAGLNLTNSQAALLSDVNNAGQDFISTVNSIPYIGPFLVGQAQTMTNASNIISDPKATTEDKEIATAQLVGTPLFDVAIGLAIGSGVSAVGGLTGLAAEGSTAAGLTPTQTLVNALFNAAIGTPVGVGIGNAVSYATTGQPLTIGQDITTAGISALLSGTIGAVASPPGVIGSLPNTLVAALKNAPELSPYTLDDYIEEFGTNPQINDFQNTLTHFNADPTKAIVYANSDGTIGTPTFSGLYYNDVHLGYASAADIQNYLQNVEASGNPITLGSASPATLPNEYTVESKVGPNGEGLRGVRANANPATEGQYFNVPTEEGRAIYLNYNSNLGTGGNTGASASVSLPQLSLNPFGAKGTFLETTTNIANIALNTVNQFTSETGLDLTTPEGQTAFSAWLSQQATAGGKEFFYPYQNYIPGQDEIQVMKVVLSDIKSLNTGEALIDTPAGGSLFIKLAQASNLGEDLDTALSDLTPEETAALAKAYTDLASSASSSGTGGYITPLSASVLSSAIGSSFYSLPSLSSTPSVNPASSSLGVPQSSLVSGSPSVNPAVSSVNPIPSTNPSVISSNPAVSSVPSIPGISSVPSIPSTSSIPSVPSVTSSIPSPIPSLTSPSGISSIPSPNPSTSNPGSSSKKPIYPGYLPLLAQLQHQQAYQNAIRQERPVYNYKPDLYAYLAPEAAAQSAISNISNPVARGLGTRSTISPNLTLQSRRLLQEQRQKGFLEAIA